MVTLLGWCLCPECGELDYRDLGHAAPGVGGIGSHCLYLWCAKAEGVER